MSFQEKRGIVSLLGTLAATAIYGLYIQSELAAGQYSDLEPLAFWAAVTLYLMPVTIGMKIIIHIVFSIIITIATREEEPGFSDELDKQIELKSTRNAAGTIILGLIGSMIPPVMGSAITVMFLGIIATLVLMQLVWDLSGLYFNRRGF